MMVSNGGDDNDEAGNGYGGYEGGERSEVGSSKEHETETIGSSALLREKTTTHFEKPGRSFRRRARML